MPRHTTSEDVWGGSTATASHTDAAVLKARRERADRVAKNLPRPVVPTVAAVPVLDSACGAEEIGRGIERHSREILRWHPEYGANPIGLRVSAAYRYLGELRAQQKAILDGVPSPTARQDLCQLRDFTRKVESYVLTLQNGPPVPHANGAEAIGPNDYTRERVAARVKQLRSVRKTK